MSTPNQTDSQDQLNRISEIIRLIENKSGKADYIYRGEPKHYREVASLPLPRIY